MAYEFREIEARWQKYWDAHKTFRTGIDRERPKYYVLDMFPYPSGDGLHVGHPEGYTATDILARYKRMRGFNVLHPMGWDAFGLPAERFAIQTGTHPAKRTAQCISNFKRQLKTLGFSYDWEREIDTTDPKYFRWTQWIFLKIWNAWFDTEQQKARPIDELPIPEALQKQGALAIAQYRDQFRLAYLKDAPVNWCPELRIVLANEEVAEHVEAGREVIRVPMTQWMLRITAYSERLLQGLDRLDWPASVKAMQYNWIGRSEGAEVQFSIADGMGDDARRGQAQVGKSGPDIGPTSDSQSISVFTTRPDTLFGATYMVLAPEHPLVSRLSSVEKKSEVEAYVQASARRSERDRQADILEGVKSGVFIGAYVINPVNGERLPIWIADYVLMGYGTGAIMAVPGHDERDHAFARAHGLKIVQVVNPTNTSFGRVSIEENAFVGEGIAVNSGILNGLATAEAKTKIIEWLEEQDFGSRRISYKLRDWLFSRQRYWGEPFPLIHGSDGVVHPVPDEELPVELPTMEDYSPSESGEPPLANAQQWRELADGSLRETNTMPQWAGSCWYYLRFMDPSNSKLPWSEEAQSYWLPVDLYVGGAEHAVLHLLYSRFWHKVLFDLKYVSTEEPFKKLVNQGMILGATFLPKDRRRDSTGKPVVFLPAEVELESTSSEQWVHRQTRETVEIQWDKMSKSRGNVVNPDEVVQMYGADTMRLYEMFMGPLEASAPWQPEGVTGCHKFLQRAYRLFVEQQPDGSERPKTFPVGEGSPRQRRVLHQTIAEVSDRIEQMTFNTAISSLMVFVRDIEKDGELLAQNAAEKFALLLAPFAPHLAEEFWSRLGKTTSLAHEPWPEVDSQCLLRDTWTLVLMVNGKKRGQLELATSIDVRDEPEIRRLAMQDEGILRQLAGATPKRVVYVPGKLINVVK